MRDMKQESELADGAGLLTGEVSSDYSSTVRVLVSEARPEGDTLVQYADVGSNGRYSVHVLPGVYLVSAFVDQNGDGAYTPGEPAAVVGDGSSADPLVITPGLAMELPLLDIVGPLDDIDSLVSAEDLALSNQNLGRVADLSEPVFSRESADLGMWHPVDFISNVGGGLMMLEPYDPERTPVVFVHGLRGTAAEFETVIDELDRQRFQPWVLQYPSGIRLDVVANYLLRALNSLHEQLGFARVMVVSHSMGGLITRAFVLKVAELPPSWTLSLVVTVASPLQGMPSASGGVKYSPIVVPSWRDLDPGSDFIKALNSASWPENIPWWLVFTYLPGEKSDGVVALDRQLSPRLQDQASAVFGIKASHVGVLSDRELLDRLKDQMAKWDDYRVGQDK